MKAQKCGEEFHVVMQKNMANPGREINNGEDSGWSLWPFLPSKFRV